MIVPYPPRVGVSLHFDYTFDQLAKSQKVYSTNKARANVFWVRYLAWWRFNQLGFSPPAAYVQGGNPALTDYNGVSCGSLEATLEAIEKANNMKQCY